MKQLEPLLKTLAVGLAAAYGFSLLSVKFGPFPGLGVRSPMIGK